MQELPPEAFATPSAAVEALNRGTREVLVLSQCGRAPRTHAACARPDRNAERTPPRHPVRPRWGPRTGAGGVNA